MRPTRKGSSVVDMSAIGVGHRSSVSNISLPPIDRVSTD